MKGADEKAEIKWKAVVGDEDEHVLGMRGLRRQPVVQHGAEFPVGNRYVGERQREGGILVAGSSRSTMMCHQQHSHVPINNTAMCPSTTQPCAIGVPHQIFGKWGWWTMSLLMPVIRVISAGTCLSPMCSRVEMPWPVAGQ